MTPPSRTAEARRKAYLRNVGTVKAWAARRKDTVEYARRILASELGVRQTEVPIAMAEARLQQIKLRRAINDAERLNLYPSICVDYKNGLTVRQIAEKYSFDKARVSSILKASGIQPGFRTHCKNGHEFEGDNLRISKDGWRRCRQCGRDKAARYDMRRKGTLTPCGK